MTGGAQWVYHMSTPIEMYWRTIMQGGARAPGAPLVPPPMHDHDMQHLNDSGVQYFLSGAGHLVESSQKHKVGKKF